MPSPPDVARLYADHAARVQRWVMRFGTVPEPEEVVHEIFVRVLERLDSFRAEASPTTWLYRLTTNFCINRLRDVGRRAELWREHTDTLWTAPVASADQETVTLLRQLWSTLDAELIEVGVYAYLDAMTHAEIARVLGCSERTVGNRLERLRRAATDATRGTP
jgi:RNA polymerase sigma-70 factor (ECF subfamily)